MSFFVYLIRRLDRNQQMTFYTGYTNDVERRYAEHNTQGANKGYELRGMGVISTACNRKLAMGIERYVKRLSHSAKADLFNSPLRHYGDLTPWRKNDG